MAPRTVKIYKLHYENNNYTGTVKELSELLELSEHTIRRYIDGISNRGEATYLGNRHPVYELVEVKSGDILSVGTQYEIAEKMNVKTESLWTYHKWFMYFIEEYKFIEASDDEGRMEPKKEPVEEILKQVGRMKYLNRVNKDNKFYQPWTPTIRQIKRLKEAGYQIKDVKEVVVDETTAI